MESVKKEISKKMLSMFSLKQLEEYKKKVEEREKEGHLVSLIDMWGLALEYLFQGKVKKKKKQHTKCVCCQFWLSINIWYTI